MYVDFVLSTDRFCDFDLAPYGYNYNRELYQAKPGDEISDYRDITAKIVNVGRMSMNLKTTDMLCRMRYGVPIMRKLAEWRRDAVIYGNNRNAVSDKDCLLITYTIK